MRGQDRVPNRWLIAAMCTVLQLCLGTVYAWSYFQPLLVDQFRWSNTDTSWAFSLNICCLGLSAACVIRVVMPRTAGRYSGLIFWGAVAGHASARLYVDNVTKLHESEFTLEILQHCHELARIARAKYKGLRFSIIFGLLGFVAGLAYTRIP